MRVISTHVRAKTDKARVPRTSHRRAETRITLGLGEEEASRLDRPPVLFSGVPFATCVSPNYRERRSHLFSLTCTI